MKKKLSGDAQSGFRPSECECLLLSIVHDFFISFDCNPPSEVTGIVLDISKGFDNFRHDELIYKIKSFGISDTPLNLM